MKRVFGVLLLLMVPMMAANRAEAQASLEQRLGLLERRVGTLTELMLRMDVLQREIQQMRGEMELQNHAMDALKKRQRDLYLDVDQRLNQISGAGGVPSVPPALPDGSVSPGTEPYPQATTNISKATAKQPSSTSATPGDPAYEEQAYQKAFDLLMKKRYADSRRAFQDFLASYPNGEYADNAQYWLAESSYVERDFDRALDGFSKVIDNYPDSLKVSDAMLKSGYIQYEKKQWSKAKEILNSLTRNYPGSTASGLARKRLDKMRAEGR